MSAQAEDAKDGTTHDGLAKAAWEAYQASWNGDGLSSGRISWGQQTPEHVAAWRAAVGAVTSRTRCDSALSKDASEEEEQHALCVIRHRVEMRKPLTNRDARFLLAEIEAGERDVQQLAKECHAAIQGLDVAWRERDRVLLERDSARLACKTIGEERDLTKAALEELRNAATAEREAMRKEITDLHARLEEHRAALRGGKITDPPPRAKDRADERAHFVAESLANVRGRDMRVRSLRVFDTLVTRCELVGAPPLDLAARICDGNEHTLHDAAVGFAETVAIGVAEVAS